MTISIGVNPIAWSNDDLPRLGGYINLNTCLEEARATGYSGIELGSKFPRDTRQLTGILEDHQLQLVSGWYSGHLLEQKVETEYSLMQAHLDLLQSQKSDFVIFAETSRSIHSDINSPLTLRPYITDQHWHEFTRKLNELACRLHDRGMRLVYHHHMGTVVQDIDDIDRLMNSTSDAVELLFDTGHLCYAGIDLTMVLDRYIGRIGHVHCKDVRPAVLERCLNRNTSFLKAVIDGVFTVPGDGHIDFDYILQRLSRHGYDGWLVVEAEQDPCMAEPAHYVKRGYEYLDVIIRSCT